MRPLLLSVALCLGSLFSTAQTALVGPQLLGSGATNPASPVIADFDRDGNKDVATVDYQADGTKLLIWLKRNGVLQVAQTYALDGGNVSTIVTADVNGDGAPDIVAVNRGISPSIDVFVNSGSGTFSRSQFISTVSYGENAAMADFNGDGRVDIASGNQLFLGRGDGTFDAGKEIPAQFLRVIAADLNHDGKPDLLGYNRDAGAGAVINNGDGTFRVAFQTTRPTFSAAIADFNGDGIPDLATTEVNEPDLWLWIGNGDGSFASPFSAFQESNSSPVAGDLNSDGIADIALVDSLNSRVMVLLNDGHALFSYTADLVPGDAMRDVAVGDYSGDDRDDVVLVTKTGKMVGFFAKPQPATTLLLSSNPVPQGQPVTITASVTSSEGSPTGTVKLQDSLNVLATIPLNFGTAKLTTSQLALGTHRLQAIYSGDATFASSYALANLPVTGSCSPSASAVQICSPLSGSAQTSPVSITAKGGSSVSYIELWVDGVRRTQVAGKSLSSSLALANGPHTLNVYGKVAGVVTDKKTASFIVSVCDMPATTASAVICFPHDNAQLISPVKIWAQGGSAVTMLELWIDGVKKTQASGNSVYTSFDLAAGTHRLTVYAKSGGVVTDKKVSNFTTVY
jgi:hypothetical protein